MINGCYKRSTQQKGYKAAYPTDGAHYLNTLLNCSIDDFFICLPNFASNLVIPSVNNNSCEKFNAEFLSYIFIFALLVAQKNNIFKFFLTLIQNFSLLTASSTPNFIGILLIAPLIIPPIIKIRLSPCLI